jgi:RHS repeat-associated protein
LGDTHSLKKSESLAMSTTACTSNPPLTAWANYNGTVNGTNNNQMSSTSENENQANGYDASGDIANDGINQYLYDGEGRICAVSHYVALLGTTFMTGYLYDADGTRVAKGTLQNMNTCDPSPVGQGGNGFQFSENYVVGPGGEELTMLDGNNNWQRTNVYAGGTLLATYDLVSGNPALHFHIEDPLGTRRMQLSGELANLGQPETDIQSLPFGDGLTTYPDQYAATSDDSTPLHFTGKERDQESGNDYFVSRYYGSSMGRFTSPDDGSDQDPSDPQSWNLYSYVRNNPLVGIDPSGQDCIHINVDSGAYEGTDSGDCDNSTEEKANSGQYVDGTVNTVNENSQGQVTGFSGTSDDGNLMAGSFRTSLPSTGGFDPGSLGASVFGGQNSSTWNNASGTVDLMARIEFEAAGFVFPVSHLAVVVLAGRPQNGTAQAAVGGLRRKPGTLGQFGNKSAENGVAKQVLKRTAGSGATKELVHEELQALSQDLGRPATIEEGVEAVLEALR